jgi:hypothetical protein
MIMKAETKNRLMMWTIVLLALMNISTILTILYNRNQLEMGKTGNSLDQTKSENASVRFSGHFFRDQLGFDQQQMNRFHEFNPTFRNQVQSINTDLAGQRYRMLSEMSAVTVDTNRLNQLCDSIGFMHACLKKRTYQYFLDIKKICDQQQQEKLVQLFGEMFAGDMQTGHYGRGQMGRRRGRQISN